MSKMNFIKNKTNIVIGILIVVLFGIGIALGYTYDTLSDVVVTPNIPTPTPAHGVTNTPTPTPDPHASYNVLLMGHGGAGHDGGNLTDTMIIAHIDPKEKTIDLISVPRDTWVDLPTTKNGFEKFKINHAYAIGLDDKKYPEKETRYTGAAGGGEMAKYAVEQVTGLPIRHFITVNFDGFKKAIDILGGIDVWVPVTFDDHFYPLKGEEDNDCGMTEEDIEKLTATMSGFLLEQQFPCRYEQLHFEAGLMTMDSETALKFVRSRHSDTHGGDFARAQRQKAVIAAARNKVLSLNLIPKVIPLMKEFGGMVRTDINVTTINQIRKTHGTPEDYEINSFAITDENVLKADYSNDGQFILVPKSGDNWSLVHQYVKNIVNK